MENSSSISPENISIGEEQDKNRILRNLDTLMHRYTSAGRYNIPRNQSRKC
jgi:hypothetical protein